MEQQQPSAHLEIENFEDFQSSQDQAFSHQVLVMRVMNKVIEAGCKELIEGHYEEAEFKGVTKIIYQQDTRSTFIECVRTCMMYLVCDYDDKAKKNIKILKKKERETKKRLLQEQLEYHSRGDYNFKRANPIDRKYFNPKFPYYNTFIDEQVKIYRRIFAQLTLLTKRLNFYETEDYEA